MASLEQRYAQALWNVVHAQPANSTNAVERLHGVLKESGREKLIPRIVHAYRALEKRNEVLAPRIEIADESSRTEAQAAASSVGVTAEPVVNPTLIRGWRFERNGELTDHSAKRYLVDLYRSIVSKT